MTVYRLPFDYAARRAQIEWQPQPSWTFDGIATGWEYSGYTLGTITLGIAGIAVPWEWHVTTGAVTITGDINVTGIAVPWEWHTTYGAVIASVEIAGSVVPWEWSVVTGTLTAERLHVPASGLTVRTAQKSMFGRASQKSMAARASQKQITARVA